MDLHNQLRKYEIMPCRRNSHVQDVSFKCENELKEVY